MFEGGQTTFGDLELQQIKEKIGEDRQRYLLAMAAGLGANPNDALSALLKNEAKLAGADYSREKEYMDQETIEKIEDIGRHFLPEDKEEEDFIFQIGVRALAILKEDPGSKVFTNLREMVRIWTFGAGGDKFDQALEQDA